jgi:PAS domain S-box-containing protein
MSISYIKILDNIHNQIAVINSKKKLVYSNQSFETLNLLYNSNIIELKGISIEDLFIDDLLPLKDAVKNCLKTGELVRSDYSFYYLGQISFFGITVIPEHGPEGNVDQCILIIQNNTEIELGRRRLKSRVLFFSNLIKRLPIGVYMFDQNHKDLIISLWNPEMKNMFLKSESDVIQKPLSAVFDVETIKRHSRAVSEIQKTGLYYDFPAEYIQIGSEMRCFHTILAAIENDKNEIPRSFLGIMTDVTEKIKSDLKLKRYQKELQIALKSTSEELNDTTAMFMSIMESTYGIDIFSLNKDQEYLVFNAHHKLMIQRNYDIEIETGQSFIPILKRMNNKRFNLLINDALNGKNSVTDIQLKMPDDSLIYMDAIFSPLMSKETVIGVTVVALETTNIRELEQKASTFMKIAESAEYGVLLTDNQYNIQFINQFMLNTLEFGDENPLGRNLKDYISEDQFERINFYTQSSLSKMKTRQVEIDFVSSPDTNISLLMTISGYEDMNGNYVGISFTCLDITLMKEARITLEEARNKAERASLMKSSFVANMSHEIRTPLNSILGFSKLLENKLTNPQYESYLKNILSSGEILRDLINDILDFSKIEAGKMDMNPEQYNIIDLFQELFSLFNLKASEKKIEFEIMSKGKLTEFILVDSLRLRQVMINLLSNALKFTHWGFIHVSVELSNEQLIVEFRDTGIGISVKDLNDIFNPFEQQEKQDAREFEGTGLGLSIIRKLLELMGGTIEATSDVWKGSTFTLRLPTEYDKNAQSKSFYYRENPETQAEPIICYTEEFFLSDDLKKSGHKYNIDFLPLNINDLKQSSLSQNTVLLFSHETITLKSDGLIPISLLNNAELKKCTKKPDFYFIRDDLASDKAAAMVHSIYHLEKNRSKGLQIRFDRLDMQGRKVLQKAINSQNFNDIEDALPFLRECGNESMQLADQLKECIDLFDIPLLKKLLKQIETTLSKGNKND